MTPENHRQDDAEEPKDRKEGTLGLSPAQVVGSALAAMSVAFFASWAGTAGTVIGAAVGSVIATVGAATYTWSLRRTSEAARRTAALVRQRALVTGALPRTGAQGPVHIPADSPADISVDSSSPDGGSRWRWDLPWVKVALASVVVMITGMAGITAVEAVTGKPVSALLGHDTGGGTTVGQVVGSDTSSKPSRPRRHSATPSPTAQPSESPTPSEQPQQSQPSTVPTPTPSVTPSVTPSTGTEVPSPPAESQGVAPQDITP